MLAGLRTIALTSNGVTLQRQLCALSEAGLDAMNLSLDTLVPARFETLSRRPASAWRHVWRSLERALQLGYAARTPRPLKLNVVLMRGANHDELADFVALTERMVLNSCTRGC